MSRSVFQCWSAWPGPGQAEMYQYGSGLPGGSGDVGGDDVGGMPVQAATGPVVPHRGSRVSMRRGILDIAQRDPGIERGGDERVAQGVRADVLGDPGTLSDAADDPGGTVPVQPPAIRRREQGSFGALADGQVDGAGVRGASGIVTTLPPLRVMTKVRWPRSTPSASTLAPVASQMTEMALM